MLMKKSKSRPDRRSTSVRSGEPRLGIQIFAPMTNGQNLHRALSAPEWKALSNLIIKRANHKCEICGYQGDIRRLVCHEVWKIDSRRHVQKLVRLKALCSLCHNAVHYKRAVGIANMDYDNAFEQICRVNNWTKSTARAYIKRTDALSKNLPKNFLYTVDMSHVTKYGFRPRVPVSFDTEEIVKATWENVDALTSRIVAASRGRSIAVYRMNSIFIASRVDTGAASTSERQRLLRHLPKMRFRNHVFIGLYTKTNHSNDVRDDLLRGIERMSTRTSKV